MILSPLINDQPTYMYIYYTNDYQKNRPKVNE